MTEKDTQSAGGDLIPIREGEEIDREALRAYLHGRLEGADGPIRVEQFSGGAANLTYLLGFGSGPEAVHYVLRRPPVGPVAATAHDMRREFRALSVLWKYFPPAPRAYLYCEDPSVIGAPFFIMERRSGVVIRHVVPAIFGGGKDLVANRKISQVLIDTLVDLHAVSPVESGLGRLGKPEGFLARQVRGWTDRYERAKTSDVAVVKELTRWLEDNLPPSPPPTLLHNDWRLDNMAVAKDDPGRCVAVYDWDMCTVGDPLADLGALLSLWFDPGEELAATSPMPTQVPGFMTRNEAVGRYAERSGRDVNHLAYYFVFGTFKIAVVVQQIYHRYHRGQTKDARFEIFGAVAEALFQLAAARRP
jgi:aminoglycoside phosphotransferase (APT) family kinase protein